MKEELLHYVWRTKKFDTRQLKTTRGEPLQIESFGTYHQNAGPDFEYGRVRIADEIWVGHIEMHLKSSDWYKHRHDTDPGYNNVILHVVWEHDMNVHRSDGTTIPTLILKPHTPANLTSNYQYLQASETWVPCQKMLFSITEIQKIGWLESLTIERMIYRHQQFEAKMNQNVSDVESTFYQAIARGFGMKVNAGAFEQLTQIVPYELIRKYADNIITLEALLFGQAGLLPPNKSSDEFVRKLQTEYTFLKSKHQLQAMSIAHWKFSRMRPANFPTLRIAQMAALYHKVSRPFSALSECRSLKEMTKILEVQSSEYWNTHYHFDMKAPGSKRSIGKTAIHLLLINSILPFFIYYGHVRHIEDIKEKALNILEEIPPEDNQLIREWKLLDIIPGSAMDSQALIQLKKFYCDSRRCLQCAWGSQIMNR